MITLGSTFDSGLLEMMRVFEARTGAHANDVVIEGEGIIFLVQEGEIGKAIGKEGSNLAKLRQALQPKYVEVIEDSRDVREFIAHILRGIAVKNIAVEENPSRVAITVEPGKKGLAIGRNGVMLKKLRMLLKRKFAVEEVRII